MSSTSLVAHSFRFPTHDSHGILTRTGARWEHQIATGYPFAIGFAPGLFWLWWFRRKDSLEPEPRMLVFRTFLFGCGAAGLVLLVRPSLDNLLPLEPPGRRIFADAFLLTAPLEETAKMRAFFHRELDEPLDGIIYGLAAGLGFASVENVLYLQVYDDVGIIFQRAFTATLCHAAMSGTVGFFLALAKLRNGGAGVLWASFGIVIAIFLHGLYDYLLSYEHLGFVAIVLLVPLMFTLLGLKIRWARARSADYHPDLS